MTQTNDLIIERNFTVSLETLYQAFADDKKFARWWGPEGVEVLKADWLVQTGQNYRVEMKSPMGLHILVGRFLKVEQNKELSFSWSWENDGQQGHISTANLYFSGNEKQSALKLVHQGLPDADTLGKHQHGWSGSFDRLEGFVIKASKAA